MMLPVFSIEWVIFELGKWIGMRLTEKAAKRLILGLRNVPKVDEDIFTLDRKIRDEASDEICLAERSISSAMNLASRSGSEQLLESLGYLKTSLGKFRDDFIVFTRDLTSKEAGQPEGLIYVDYILLSGCFAINEKARDLIDAIQQKEHEKSSSSIDEINKHIRDLERIGHVRSTALSISDRNFLRALESQHPNIYETIRTFAAFAYRSSAKKKGLFKKKDYDDICGRAIYIAKVLEERRGPVVELRDFYSEFAKLNPDIDISFDDLEKATGILVNNGLMGGLESSEEGLKNIILRYDYRGLLDSVHDSVKREDQGLTLEQLMISTGLPRFYIVGLLGRMERDGAARKIIEYDGTVRWFFPGLIAEKEEVIDYRKIS